MNKRIYKKIYKRSENKLAAYIELGNQRSYLKIARNERVLSGLERKIFIKEQNRRIKLVNEILEELKIEE